MKFPKNKRIYCPKCGTHTVHKVSIYKKAKEATKDRSIGDAFVMWEPDVSRAINKLGMKKLWGSDKFSGYIIDVIVFHRDVVAKNPEYVSTFLKTYFRVLNYYESRPEERTRQLAKISKLDEDEVQNMVDNIEWFSVSFHFPSNP